jgi:hypothetical protein
VQAFLDVFQAGHQLAKVQPNQVGAGGLGLSQAGLLPGRLMQFTNQGRECGL